MLQKEMNILNMLGAFFLKCIAFPYQFLFSKNILMSIKLITI